MDRVQTGGDITVTETPRYRGDHSDPDMTAEHEDSSIRRGRRSRYLLWALGAVVFATFVVLHMTGVLGPGEH